MRKTELLKTEEAITFVKKTFARQLVKKLKLTAVSAPIAIIDGTGINDDLNGIERPVRFPVKAFKGEFQSQAVVVQSLAKWKRLRIKELGIPCGYGIITDMRAIRPDEALSPIHSVYVDQWDWEKHISREERSLAKLKETVSLIYKALRKTEKKLASRYKEIAPVLPKEIKFIHSEELASLYPNLTPAAREDKIAKKYGAVFLMGIGKELSTGEPHDGRAPDYDDWSSANEEGFYGLNGDIIVWNPALERAFEISSMGIRVDSQSLLAQLNTCACPQRAELYFHQLLLNNELHQTMGGGIGQSRVCMFMLRKKHIGQVQVGVWPEQIKEQLLAYDTMLM